MKLYNFRKETSERSDAYNWAKKQLIDKTDMFFGSIEGCNQNARNQTTHMFERAHVDIDFKGIKSKTNVLQSILELESKDVLQRKINFVNRFDLPLSYVLHNDDSGYVFILEFLNTENTEIVKSFKSYQSFGDYLAKIKGWKSGKKFREFSDLPQIDKVLRVHGTPWPTNIDCFCSNSEGLPIAIIEYQNASKIGVLNHSNNDYFLCKQKKTSQTNQGIKTIYHDDIRRWTSQDILRVQSELPLIVITWAKDQSDFQIKEIDTITFPDFETSQPEGRWNRIQDYKELLHQYTVNTVPSTFMQICAKKSYSLLKKNNLISEYTHSPPLSKSNKTFPTIYWKKKAVISSNKDLLSTIFSEWIC